MNSKSSQNAEKEQTRGKKEQRGEIKCAQERLWDAFGRFRGETFDFSGLGGGPKIDARGPRTTIRPWVLEGFPQKA